MSAVLALLGVFLNQLFFAQGPRPHLPVVAGALQRGSIGLHMARRARARRRGSVSIRTRDGRLKLAGVALCVTGAMITSFYQGAVAVSGRDLDRRTARAILGATPRRRTRTRGGTRIITPSASVSSSEIAPAWPPPTLQQRVLARYPHPRG